MFSGPGRKWIGWAWAIVLFAACGGSVVESNDTGGAGGQAGVDRGGAAGIPPTGGASGSVGRGGISGAAGRGGFAGASGGGMGGYAGSAGYGGGIAGAAGSPCFDQGCAPGNRCCSFGAGCVTTREDGELRCYCSSGSWQCELIDIGDGTCPPGTCGGGTVCCRGRCVSLQNDPDNCGKCGNACGGRFCDFGVCNAIPCNVPQPAPDGGLLCCGNFYCGPGLTCCPLLSGTLACYQPSPGQPACPQM